MLKLDTYIKANKLRYYTGVGVLIVTKYLNKPCIILGLEKNKSKQLTDKLSNILNNLNKPFIDDYEYDPISTQINKTKNIKKTIKTTNNNTTTNNTTTTDNTTTNNTTTDNNTTTTDNTTTNNTTTDNTTTDNTTTNNTTTDNNTTTKIKQLKQNKKINQNRYNSTKHSTDIVNNKQIYIYEEFGGGIQDKNLSLEENACFELCEETSNLLNFTNPFVLNKGVNTFFDIPYLKDRLYRLYVVYIDDFTKDIHLFYKNKHVLRSNPSNYYKYRNFTEISDITFLEIDNIDKYINNYNNYLTINSEELLYNQINKDKGITKYKGILKCIDNIYLSKRLVDFLNMNFIYDKESNGYIYYNDNIDENINKEIYNKFNKTVKNYKPFTTNGLNFCKHIFKQSTNNNIDTKNLINLTKPRKNNKNSIKYNFLNHTYSIDAF